MGGDVKNIVAINTANSGGGAEKVAYTLCKELHLRGYNSSMLAKRIEYDADELAPQLVHSVPGHPTFFKIGNYLDEVLSTQYLFYFPSWKLTRTDRFRNADVVHLHNIHGNYFNLLALPSVLKKKPVVWTLHDMWSFTGKCSHSYDCARFEESCGNCPQLQAYPKLRRDTTRFHLALKRMLYKNRSFTLIAPSEWLRGKINRSILREQRVEVVPSPVDTKTFYEMGKREARCKLGIPEGKKVVMFIASWVNSIPSKGLSIFKELMRDLMREGDDVFFIVVGHLEGQSVLGDAFPGLEPGWVQDPARLRHYYSAADVFVSPTLAENSSCTIAEAMACGAPVVAFATGGVPEQIVANVTGYAVPTGNFRELYAGVVSLLRDPQRAGMMGKQGAESARSRFALEKFVSRHEAIYGETIGRFNHH